MERLWIVLTLRMSCLSSSPTPPITNWSLIQACRNESKIAAVYAASADDVDTAVNAARNALEDPSWRDISATERGNLMIKLSQLVEENAETLATIETWDNGKPYTAALNEDVAEVAAVFKYYGGWADKIYGQVIDAGPEKFAYTIREPVGVCGQIVP